MKNSKTTRVAYWATTSLFSLWMLFTAYAQLALPQVRQAFLHLGFPDYFRVELSVAKILGVLVLLLPAPARLKEWAYSGFTVTLASALIAHLSAGDGVAVYLWAVVAGACLGLSYVSFRTVNGGGGLNIAFIGKYREQEKSFGHPRATL